MTATTSAPGTDAQAPEPPPRPRPRPAPSPGAPSRARDDRMRLVQLVMFAAGGVLMPMGVLAICLGWYGSAHAHYEYDQNVYLLSGGVLGLGLVFLGGFLYFGAWLSRMSTDQRHASAQLTDALLALADVMAARQRSTNPGGLSHAEVTATIPALAELVTAGSNTTVHRRDCPLINSRDDLHSYLPDGTVAATCRVCKPQV